MNNTTNTLISSIASGDKAGSSDMFNTIMNDKIADVINSKLTSVGSSMLKQDVESEVETES